MIEIVKPPDKYASCASCWSRKEMVQVLVSHNDNIRTCFTLCKKCLSDMYDRINIKEAKE